MIVDQVSKSSGSSNSSSTRKAKIQKPKKIVAQNTSTKNSSFSAVKNSSKCLVGGNQAYHHSSWVGREIHLIV